MARRDGVADATLLRAAAHSRVPPLRTTQGRRGSSDAGTITSTPRASVDDTRHALPPLTRQQLQQLRVCPVHPKESALDVPLRLVAPTEMHCAALCDAPSTLPHAWHLTTLLKGRAACTSAAWAPHHSSGASAAAASACTAAAGHDDKDGDSDGDRAVMRTSVVHLDTITDARARIAAALRAKDAAHAGKLLCTLGALHYNCGNIAACHDAFAQALVLFTRVQYGVGVVYCRNILGVCSYRSGDYAASLSHHASCRDMGGSYVRAVALLNMGVAHAALHDLARAQHAFDDACAEAIAAGDSMLEAIARGNGGLVALRAGTLREAHDRLERCLQLCSVAGDANGAALCLLLLGDACARVHDYDHALFYYEQAYRIGGEADNVDVVGVARVRIGVTRGEAALKQAVLQHAADMGRRNHASDILPLLPP